MMEHNLSQAYLLPRLVSLIRIEGASQTYAKIENLVSFVIDF
jgi:hypothetical protein